LSVSCVGQRFPEFRTDAAVIGRCSAVCVCVCACVCLFVNCVLRMMGWYVLDATAVRRAAISVKFGNELFSAALSSSSCISGDDFRLSMQQGPDDSSVRQRLQPAACC
jgi:hypothetical protein